MTEPSAYRMTVAHVRSQLAASMGGWHSGHATSVAWLAETSQSVIVSDDLAGRYKDSHWDGAWIHFRTNSDVGYDQVNYYVVSFDGATGGFTIDANVGADKEGDRFDLFSVFSPVELDNAMRLGLEEVRLYYHTEYDSLNEKEEIYAHGLFESSQVKGVWFRSGTGVSDAAGHSDEPWIHLNNWEVFENNGRVFIQVPYQYTPAREFFSNKEIRIEYIGRYNVTGSDYDSPEEQFDVSDSAIVGGDLQYQIARCREHLYYSRLHSCDASKRDFWGQMLQENREALKQHHARRPRVRARKALLTRWGKHAGNPI